MILVAFLVVYIAAGALAWAAARWSANAARWLCLGASVLNFALGLNLWARNRPALDLAAPGGWFAQFACDWIPEFGIRFHLAVDGLSMLLLMLTFFIGIVAVLASWTEIRQAVGFFHFNLMAILAGITGVFLAEDLFLFYFAWELMLVPMYFLIALWGHENRIYAAVKFFIFTQLSGLLMLIAILALYFYHHAATGVYTFAYTDLLATPMPFRASVWIMLGFFVAFAVKLPAFPFHPWLPDAHTEAPTAGSVVLAALMLKTGGYGMLRFVVPLFPSAARWFAPAAMWLGVAGILYGAVLAFAQTDLKRLVAYTSVSHLGFVLLGVFAWNPLALQGAVVQMIAHGISTGALFVIVGALQERTHTREMDRLGGLWDTVPVLSGSALFFALASLGLPGMGDFVGEFLVLLGAWPMKRFLVILAAIGVLLATVYALKVVQRAFHGSNLNRWQLPDFGFREALAMALMMGALLWIGFYPQPVLDTFSPSMEQLQKHATEAPQVVRR